MFSALPFPSVLPAEAVCPHRQLLVSQCDCRCKSSLALSLTLTLSICPPLSLGYASCTYLNINSSEVGIGNTIRRECQLSSLLLYILVNKERRGRRHLLFINDTMAKGMCQMLNVKSGRLPHFYFYKMVNLWDSLRIVNAYLY